MNLAAPPPQPEKSNIKALILSALVHIVLIGALFFGVQWKSQAPSSVEVEVWRAAPPPVARPEPAPEVKREPKPEPKPEPKVESPPQPKPEIAIKEKPKKEEPKKPEAKPAPKPEPKPEPKPKPDAKREAPDFAKQIEAEQKERAKEKAVEEARNQAQAEADRIARVKADQATAARQQGKDKYGAAIRGKIRGNIVLPPNIQGNPEAVFIVTQLPTGEVLPPVRIQKSSGNPQLDAAIERAILKSSPLPKPDDPRDFDRELRIPYRPVE